MTKKEVAMQKLFILGSFLFFFSISLAGQVDISPQFSKLLELSQLDFHEPLEAKYKDVSVLKNPWQSYDFAIRSRKERLEIRYLVIPNNESNPLNNIPHIKCMQMVTNVASNSQEVVVTGLSVRESDLKEQFNADWGKVFLFQPKPGFSSKEHCKLLALHKEGIGTAFVFFLFNKPDQNLDNRFYALSFRNNEQ